MKGTICDFCGTAWPASDKTNKFYSASMRVADGYTPDGTDNALLFDAPDVCRECSTQLNEAMRLTRANRGGKRQGPQ